MSLSWVGVAFGVGFNITYLVSLETFEMKLY